MVRLTEPLAETGTEPWLLMRHEAGHLRRVATLCAHLASEISLP